MAGMGLVYSSRLMCCDIRRQTMVTAWYILIVHLLNILFTDAVLEAMSFAFNMGAIQQAAKVQNAEGGNTIIQDDSMATIESILTVFNSAKAGVVIGNAIMMAAAIMLLIATVKLKTKCLVWPFMILTGLSIVVTCILGIVCAALIPFFIITILIATLIGLLHQGYLLLVSITFYRALANGLFKDCDDVSVLVKHDTLACQTLTQDGQISPGMMSSNVV